MSQPYQLPTATVLSADLSLDVATVSVRISQSDYLSYPIAPASLWRLNADEKVFELHQLVHCEGPRLVFETYEPATVPPIVGADFRFCSWWMPHAMNAVRDTSAIWERLAYRGDGHDHCLLTWEKVSATDGEREGYHSEHGWVTVGAYREFIALDRLRIRGLWRSVE
jgi:hypothetical protein